MATVVRDARTNGADRTGELALEPPRRRRGRLPEVALGVLVMVGFALAAVLWHLNAIRKDPALALARAVERGEVISERDLRVVHVASDRSITLIPPSDEGRVVGRTAVADLAAGTLLTPAVAQPVPKLGSGDGVVGLALEGGQLPSSNLRPGDVVNVVLGNGDGAGREREDVLVERAVVVEVEELGTQGRRFVSLRTEETAANRVASAPEGGPVRLVLVAP